MTDRMTTVQGRCPACGWTSLFLGDGGHVTCSRLECPNPSAVDDLLNQPPTSAASGDWLRAGTRDLSIPAHNAGPSIRECADQDAAHWNAKYAGEGQ